MIDWKEIEKESPINFKKFIDYLNSKNINIDNVDKSSFNTFISDSNLPKFLNIPNKYDIDEYVIKTTFRGIDVFEDMISNNTKIN